MNQSIAISPEEDIAEQMQRYRMLAQISSDWFWETDQHYTVTYMSESVKRITGYPPEQYIGVSRYRLASAETRQTPEWKRHLELVRRQQPIKNFEYKHIGSNGQVSYLRVNAIPLLRDDGQFRGYLGTTTDITELIMARKRTEKLNKKLEKRTQQLEVAKLAAEQMALTDSLTGLNNRRAFYDFGKTLEQQARRFEHPYSVIMLDIDLFKLVNDSHGHAVGDEVLKAVAREIFNSTRTCDVAGRLGGEEFALVLPETDANGAAAIAERLRCAIENLQFPLQVSSLKVTSSFGIAHCTDGNCNLEDILSRADLALYRAKDSGRNRVETLDAEVTIPQGTSEIEHCGIST